MKSLLTYPFIVIYVLWTLVSCAPLRFLAQPITAFTAPKGPDGIRQDIPRDAAGNKLWSDFDPLNIPGNDYGPYEINPADTWEERTRIFSGHF